MVVCKTYEAGEGEFEEQEVGRALVAANFSEGYRPWFVAARFAAFVLVY